MFLIFPISSAASLHTIGDAQSLRAAAPQSMKWLTEYFGAEAMFVSRREPRRRLFADDVNLREAIDHRSQFQATHSR
jgi:hypothetical protein